MLLDQHGKADAIETDAAVFAIGHSARDTFYMLKGSGVEMEMLPKSFAVGMRINHHQRDIDCLNGPAAKSGLFVCKLLEGFDDMASSELPQCRPSCSEHTVGKSLLGSGKENYCFTFLGD